MDNKERAREILQKHQIIGKLTFAHTLEKSIAKALDEAEKGEREACAKVAETIGRHTDKPIELWNIDIAEAIRARGERNGELNNKEEI